MMLLVALGGVLATCATGCASGEMQTTPVPVLATDSPNTPVQSPTPPQLSYVTTSGTNGLSALRCENCPDVDVVEVIDAETVLTTDGPVRLYGVFVSPQEQNCFDEATDRLRILAGTRVRLEQDAQETDASGTPIRYVYTANGDSVDEVFISEGLARPSAFNGTHAPWLLITAEKARQARSGCIWENYDRLFPQRTPVAPG